MGRTEASLGRPPAAFRKQQRAKRAKETLSKVIPALLASDARARNGNQSAELIVDPHSNYGDTAEFEREAVTNDNGSKSKGKGKSKKDGGDQGVNASLNPKLPSAVKDKTAQSPPKVMVVVTDTLTAAARLNQSSHSRHQNKKSTAASNVAVLNMASMLRPGGGFTSGATSQEEYLCMRTTLLPSLREEFYRLPEVGGIWTPDVLVYRDSTAEANELARNDRYYVNVITAGAIRFPESTLRTTYKGLDGEVTDQRTAEQFYASAADAQLTRRKMKAVLRILRAKACKRVVLGAWGCGAYGNPVGEVARAWKEVLLGLNADDTSIRGSVESWFGLTEVIFAISHSNMAEDFSKHWGGELPVEYLSTAEGESNNEDEDDAAQADLRDLHQKMGQLRIQIDNAKTPILKSGLEDVLKKLQNQLDDRRIEHKSDVGIDSTGSEGSRDENRPDKA